MSIFMDNKATINAISGQKIGIPVVTPGMSNTSDDSIEILSLLELNNERKDKITIIVVKNKAMNPIQIENSPNILQNLRGREIVSNIFCPLFVLIININPRTFVAFHFSRNPSFSSILITNMLRKIRPK